MRKKPSAAHSGRMKRYKMYAKAKTNRTHLLPGPAKRARGRLGLNAVAKQDDGGPMRGTRVVLLKGPNVECETRPETTRPSVTAVVRLG